MRGPDFALLRMQRELLHAQIADLSNVVRIFVAAVDGIDSSELLQQLADPAKFAGDRSRNMNDPAKALPA
jgi:hypothetical protein